MPVRVLTPSFINDLVEQYPDLDSVDLSHNSIEKIENLSQIASLKVLDLSHNDISVLDNIHCLPLLRNLNVAHNKIAVIDKSIAECSLLEHLDLGYNLLITVSILRPLCDLPQLRSLILEGNPLCSIRDYRKQVARLLPRLDTLDGRPLLLFERLDEQHEVINSCEELIMSKSNFKDRTLNYSSISQRSSSPQSRRRDFHEDRYQDLQPEICGLMKQIQLRDIQIASFDKVLKLQSASDKKGSDGLLNCWRNKVYELLVQLESQNLQLVQQELEFRSAQQEHEAQIETLQKDLLMIKESVNRQLVENELLSNRKLAIEGALTKEKAHTKSLVYTMSKAKQSIQKAKALMRQRLQSFQETFFLLIQASDEMDAYSQRIKFALSRVKIYSDIIEKRNSRDSSFSGQYVPSSIVSNSRMRTMEREIEQLSQERLLLLCKVADFDRRIQAAIENATKSYIDKLQKAADDHNACLAQLDHMEKDNHNLRSQLSLQQSETTDLKARLQSERDSFISQRNSLIETNVRAISEMANNIKEVIVNLSCCNEEIRKECLDLKLLHESDINRISKLESQLLSEYQHLQDRLGIQAASYQLLIENSAHKLQALESENSRLKSSLGNAHGIIARLSEDLKTLSVKQTSQDAQQQTESENIDSRPPILDSRIATLQRLESLASSWL